MAMAAVMTAGQDSVDMSQLEYIRTIVIRPHEATDATQIELKVNDIVYVLEQDETGWWGGFKESEEQTGWFPGSCVRHLPPGEAEPPSKLQQSLLQQSMEERGNRSLMMSPTKGEEELERPDSPTRGGRAVASPQRRGQQQRSQEVGQQQQQAVSSALSSENAKLKQENEVLADSLQKMKRQSNVDRQSVVQLEHLVEQERIKRESLEVDSNRDRQRVEQAEAFARQEREQRECLEREMQAQRAELEAQLLAERANHENLMVQNASLQEQLMAAERQARPSIPSIPSIPVARLAASPAPSPAASPASSPQAWRGSPEARGREEPHAVATTDVSTISTASVTLPFQSRQRSSPRAETGSMFSAYAAPRPPAPSIDRPAPGGSPVSGSPVLHTAPLMTPLMTGNIEVVRPLGTFTERPPVEEPSRGFVRDKIGVYKGMIQKAKQRSMSCGNFRESRPARDERRISASPSADRLRARQQPPTVDVDALGEGEELFLGMSPLFRTTPAK